METTKLRFKNKQQKHSLTLKDGTVIKPQQEFEASMELIPKAFKDMVEVLSVAGKPAEEKPKPNITRTVKVEESDKKVKKPGKDETIDETIEKPADGQKKILYTKKHIGRGKYNVLDEDGKEVNSTPLTGIKAKQLIDELTK